MSSLITSFADIESKEIQWLWNPYIALGKLTLAYGTKETDMTDYMLRFTAALSTGGTGEPPCSILYFEGEHDRSLSLFTLKIPCHITRFQRTFQLVYSLKKTRLYKVERSLKHLICVFIRVTGRFE